MSEQMKFYAFYSEGGPTRHVGIPAIEEPEGQAFAGESWIEVTESFDPDAQMVVDGVIVPRPASADDLSRHLTALREGARRTATVTVDDAGTPVERVIDTAPSDLGILANLLVGVQAGARPDPFMFRGGGESAPITHAQFLDAYSQASVQVQAAYDAQEAVEAAIEAGTITDLAALDAAFEAALAAALSPPEE